MTEPTSQATEPNAPPPAASPAPSIWRHPAVIVSLLALGLLGWQWLESRSRLQDIQEEMARRLAAGDVASNEARSLSRQNQDTLRAVQERIGALDARIDQMQGQQGALDALYQELARTRDDRLLAEVEQAINIANQQLQLAGNVETALLALQSADQQLARADRAHFLPLRKALNRDIDRLKALPAVDVPGLTLKIEGVLAGVDSLPLAFEKKPAVVRSREARGEKGFFASLFDDIWQEIRQLVRIERLDRPDPGLLSPNHALFLRENLKIRLLDARLALLQRDSRVFNEDIRQARSWIERYFDGSASVTQAALETLAQLSNAKLVIELPVLTESLAAHKSLKFMPERAPVKASAPQGGR